MVVLQKWKLFSQRLSNNPWMNRSCWSGSWPVGEHACFSMDLIATWAEKPGASFFKLESRRNNLKWTGTPLNQKKRQQSSGGTAQHPA